MIDDQVSKLEKLSSTDLEKIVHQGDNLNIPTSYASKAKRILDTRRHEELIEATTRQNNTEEVDKYSDLTIFYSWQSDLPSKVNRSLIEESIELAVKNIRQDDSIKVIPRMDKDTAGVPGSPNIANTILEKIDRSFLIVSDVTITSNHTVERPSPNPNVLFELGYAVKSLGVENIIMVQNTAYGPPEKLPFDLRTRRVLTYRFADGDVVATVKKELVAKLEIAIRLSLTTVHNKLSVLKKNSKVEEFIQILSSNQPPVVIENKLKTMFDEALTELKQSKVYSYNDPLTLDEFNSRRQLVETVLSELIPIFINFGRWADKTQITPLLRQFRRILSIPEPDGSYFETWEGVARYPGLLLMYSLGLGAIYNENVDILKALFNIEIYNRFTGKNEPLLMKTNAISIFRDYKELTKSNRYYPVSDEIFSFFKQYFSDLPENEYEDIFDSFEYFLSLIYCSWVIQNTPKRIWVPQGSFIWRTQRRKIWATVKDKYDKNGENWIFFHSFNLDQGMMAKVFDTTNEFVSRISIGL